MIKAKEIKEILRTYEKYGWVAERVLLTDTTSSVLSSDDLNELFGNTSIRNSDVDGVWFTRRSKNDHIAWELRHLDTNPFALMELIEIGSTQSETEKKLKLVETRLANYASKKLSKKDH